MKSKLQQCLQCAGNCIITTNDEYEEHLAKVRNVLLENACDPYPYTVWLYAIEAYEIQHGIESAVPSILNSVKSET